MPIAARASRISHSLRPHSDVRADRQAAGGRRSLAAMQPVDNLPVAISNTCRSRPIFLALTRVGCVLFLVKTRVGCVLFFRGLSGPDVL